MDISGPALLGYGMALAYGHLGWFAGISVALLLMAAFAARQQTPVRPLPRPRPVHLSGPGTGAALAARFLQWSRHRPQRFTDDAVPFSMYLNLDKPLIGFWLLLVCPWIVGQRSLRVSLYATALALTLSAVLALGGALLLGVIAWAPKWPDQAWMWLLNNLLLVTLVEEALFRGYIQGGLSRCSKPAYGENLALLLASLLFGLAHAGAGWHGYCWRAGVGYGLAYRFGGLCGDRHALRFEPAALGCSPIRCWPADARVILRRPPIIENSFNK
jgi:O-antigen/teichoic acid export membrane protein